MNSAQFDALIADLDRAANLFKQLASAGLIIGGIIAALALSGCCDDERPLEGPDVHPRAQRFGG